MRIVWQSHVLPSTVNNEKKNLNSANLSYKQIKIHPAETNEITQSPKENTKKYII